MNNTHQLSRSEAERQIAELQRHINSLPTNNHPSKYERGQLFERRGQTYMVVSAGEENSGELDLRAVVGRHGVAWMKNKFFDGDESEFTYLGHAKDLLVLKTDKPAEVVVTDEIRLYNHGKMQNAWSAFTTDNARTFKSLKNMLTLALNGKL